MQQQLTEGHYRELLLDYLQERKRKNSLFSLRTLAKNLQISPAQLSQFMSGKRPLTLRVALQIADKLEFSSLERRQILEIADGKESVSPKPSSSYEQLDEDQFRIISEWYYFAILSLGNLTRNEASPKWIAKRLNLDLQTARSAYEKLKRLGYIKESRNQFRQTSKPLHTTSDIPSAAIRKNHRQNLELAAQKLEDVEVQMREFTSVTIAMDPKKLKRAKEMMNQFKNELYQYLGKGEKSEVYTLALQLFPVTDLKEKTP